MSKRVLVIGAGAVGGYYGAILASVGCEVSLVCRSEANDIVESGIAIESPNVDIQFKPKAVYSSSLDAAQSDYDLLILSTKVLPSCDLMSLLGPLAASSRQLLLLQNGIFIENSPAALFPDMPIISGLAFVCLNRLGGGRILHQGYGRLVLGAYPDGSSQMVAALVQAFVKGGINCKQSEAIQRDRWRKMVWNVPFNALSVVMGGWTTADILADAVVKARVRRLMEEVCVLAEADGYALDASVIDKNITDTEKMAPYKTSMLLDYEAGRPMEVEAILGNALKFAKTVGVSVPEMAQLYSALYRLDSVSTIKS